MTLTPQQIKSRLAVLLKTGQISQRDHDERVRRLDAEIRQAAAQPTPPPDRYHRPAPPRAGGGPVPQGRPRDDNAHLASATYRFVPYDAARIVLAEKEARGPINQAKAGGLCALIDVQWQAESPLLIGAEGKKTDADKAVTTPLQRHADGSYVIPGTTIKGALRAIAEITSGARLSQVNRERVFPLRDLNHGLYRPKSGIMPALKAGQNLYPVAKVGEVKAGWLRLRTDKQLPPLKDQTGGDGPGKRCGLDEYNDCFEIEPCTGTHFRNGWAVVKAKDLLASGYVHRSELPKLPPNKATGSADTDFTLQPMLTKYASVGATVRSGKIETIAPATKTVRLAAQPDHYGAACLKPDPAGTISGCLVFSGPAAGADKPEKRKKVEYAFPPPATTGAVPVDSVIMKRFRQINSQAIDETLTPEHNWETAWQAMAADPKTAIPVFYVGELGNQTANGKHAFFFGLTRFFKVPHAWPFATVLNNSGVSDPVANGKVQEERLDMVDALFGYVYETTDTEPKKPSDVARKGRVAFSAAHLTQPELAKETDAIETIMMGPKPSYAPYYLQPDRDGFRDYSADLCPKIAGRKRYPARIVPGRPDAALDRVTAKLQRQIDLVRQAGRGEEPKDKVKTRLQFLVPTGQDALTFRSQIRLFNVTQAELGLVLWALTFGGSQEKSRHMIGRAKPFGAGQMKVSVTRLLVEQNATAGAIDVAESGWKKYFEALDGHIRSQGHLSSVEDARKALLAMADPMKGQELDKNQKLDGMELKNFARLRDMVKRDVDGRRPYAKPLLQKP